MIGNDGRTVWCEARTARQERPTADWPVTGCMKPAIDITPDGHYACRTHLTYHPRGWNE